MDDAVDSESVMLVLRSEDAAFHSSSFGLGSSADRVRRSLPAPPSVRNILRNLAYDTPSRRPHRLRSSDGSSTPQSASRSVPRIRSRFARETRPDPSQSSRSNASARRSSSTHPRISRVAARNSVYRTRPVPLKSRARNTSPRSRSERTRGDSTRLRLSGPKSPARSRSNRSNVRRSPATSFPAEARATSISAALLSAGARA
mmetsp:Transcript_39618/g.92689  ORF Transcript_39618/g.92689 Transcript_39618/m.92689 type:complete len:202 (+) Transcript_39618:212-817(+)